MFENLSQRLQQTVKTLKGQARLSEDNIKEALRDVRMALLEADVALPVVKQIIAEIKDKAIGAEVNTKLSPGQAFIKIVHAELTEVMGQANDGLALSAQPPAVILMAGLQGSGKTTSTAKLAKRLIEREHKKVAVVSADVYRPAAIEQLATVASQVGADFIPSSADEKPLDIAQRALAYAKQKTLDVLIIDTAGRLHIDAEMMAEIQAIHSAVDPVETLFVVDAMTGQDAANTAKAFHDALALTGVILTKIDGDARGGAALSIRHITGKPIKFLGIGEKTDALEAFHPERIASRILGMGDVLSLVEDIQHQVDQDKAEKLAKKMQSGQKFTLVDYKDQLEQMQGMDIAKLMEKIPGMSEIPQQVRDQQLNSKQIGRMVAIINAMTPEERLTPELIKSSRKKRIAAGSGIDIPEVNRMLKQFKEMQKQMANFNSGKMGKMLKMANKMQGKVPGLMNKLK
ncbi:signal recognition particle protein [Ostreibacterium oceani]|uniref:Signal recognition particle protein n=1 Tax=Ostreibacterium oceani TaxID=2654998 RepID=A0A6N7F1G5_9GAMM|nr:signal recognition particle protein [Ostreibacterium oceani]MPV85696.1 signal recognition particle protein [Ostreibacterium oceani]